MGYVSVPCNINPAAFCLAPQAQAAAAEAMAQWDVRDQKKSVGVWPAEWATYDGVHQKDLVKWENQA